MNAVTALAMLGPGVPAAGVAGEPVAEESSFGALLETALLGEVPADGSDPELVGAMDVATEADSDEGEPNLPEILPPAPLGAMLPPETSQAPATSNAGLPEADTAPTAAGDRPAPPGATPVAHGWGSDATETVDDGRAGTAVPPAPLDASVGHPAPVEDQVVRVAPEAAPLGDRTDPPASESTPARPSPIERPVASTVAPTDVATVEPPPPSRAADSPQMTVPATGLDAVEGTGASVRTPLAPAALPPTVATMAVAPTHPTAAAPSAAATPPTGVSLPPVEDPNVARIGGAIRTIQRGETRVTTVSLRPAELGHVRIELHEEGGRLALRMLPSSPEAREVLRVAEGAIRRELAGSGVQLDRIEVEVGSGGGDPRRGHPTLARFEDSEFPAVGWPATVRRPAAPSGRAISVSTSGLEVDL